MRSAVNLQQLAYFREAYEQRSFSAAAKVLRLAQPSLSEQIRRLEGELGVPLFVRVGRGVEPTEAGHALLPHAERVLAEVESARESVAGVRDVRAGHRQLRHLLDSRLLPAGRSRRGLHRPLSGRAPAHRRPQLLRRRRRRAGRAARGRPRRAPRGRRRPARAAGAARRGALHERASAPRAPSRDDGGARPQAADLHRRQPRGRRSDAPADRSALPGGGRHDRSDRRGRVPQRGPGPRSPRSRRRARARRGDAQPPLPRRPPPRPLRRTHLRLVRVRDAPRRNPLPRHRGTPRPGRRPPRPTSATSCPSAEAQRQGSGP